MITESGTKLNPATASRVPALPARMAGGDTDEIVGTGFLTGSGKKVELPPPGDGFTTAISNVPAFDTSVARTAAARSVELWKLVVRMMPFTVTVDCETKFVPVTNSVNEALPVEADLGDSEVIWGTALLTASIVNVRVWVVPPPGAGVSTATVAVPAFWMSLAKI